MEVQAVHEFLTSLYHNAGPVDEIKELWSVFIFAA